MFGFWSIMFRAREESSKDHDIHCFRFSEVRKWLLFCIYFRKATRGWQEKSGGPCSLLLCSGQKREEVKREKRKGGGNETRRPMLLLLIHLRMWRLGQRRWGEKVKKWGLKRATKETREKKNRSLWEEHKACMKRKGKESRNTMQKVMQCCRGSCTTAAAFYPTIHQDVWGCMATCHNDKSACQPNTVLPDNLTF